MNIRKGSGKDRKRQTLLRVEKDRKLGRDVIVGDSYIFLP